MSEIFISYRRTDVEAEAGRLHDDLSRYFWLGKNRVSSDFHFDKGRNFRGIIVEKLASCKVLLAVIGPGWLDAKDAAGNRRLDDPKDLVRQEVSVALSRNISVVPVLLNGADIPDPRDLPDDLRGLSDANSVEIRIRHWDSDVRNLAKELHRLGIKKISNKVLAWTAAAAVVLAFLCVGIFQRKKTPNPPAAVHELSQPSTSSVPVSTNQPPHKEIAKMEPPHTGPNLVAGKSGPNNSTLTETSGAASPAPDHRSAAIGSKDRSATPPEISSAATSTAQTAVPTQPTTNSVAAPLPVTSGAQPNTGSVVPAAQPMLTLVLNSVYQKHNGRGAIVRTSDITWRFDVLVNDQIIVSIPAHRFDPNIHEVPVKDLNAGVSWKPVPLPTQANAKITVRGYRLTSNNPDVVGEATWIKSSEELPASLRINAQSNDSCNKTLATDGCFIFTFLLAQRGSE